MRNLMLWGALVLALTACGKTTEEPELFTPRLIGEGGIDLNARKQLYCQGVNVRLDENLLTPENFRAIFDCANYDGKLDELRPLLRSDEFVPFLKNMNLIFSSGNTKDLAETLRDWFAEGSEGESRIDRLLPVLSKVIKNPAFQDGLPIVHHLLEAGESVWRDLLPGLSHLVYDERFPNNFEDVSLLLGEPDPEADYAGAAKAWARFVRSRVDGKTVGWRALDLAHRAGDIRLPGTSLPEYLDQLNEKGVFSALYEDTGALRGEVINPKLNADPDEEELRDGLSLTPEQRQARAYRKLFTRADGGDAPITQLAGLVAEFQNPHPEFLPSLAAWFSANGARVSQGVSEYVVRAQVVARLGGLNLEQFLNAYGRQKGVAPKQKLAGAEYEAFLKEAFGAPSFRAWLESEATELNEEQFGPKNAAQLATSSLVADLESLYREPAVAAYGAAISPEPLELATLNKRFSNFHRSPDRLSFEFCGRRGSVEAHTVDLWWRAADSTLGEPVVVDFVIGLAQTLFAEMAGEFGSKGVTLSEWYFQSPYGNPATTEAAAGYAMKELDLLPKWKKHRDYLKNEFASEVFANEDDRRAFRLLVDQVPHIWLYIKSGMARSGNDLNRALSSRDDGYLIKGYVGLLVSAYETGWLKDAVRLVEAYHDRFEPTPVPEPSRDLEGRREIAKGAEALRRVMRSLFEPEARGDYGTSTLGRLLVPLSSFVSPDRRAESERFLFTGATEILRADYDELNRFLRAFLQEGEEGSVHSRRETLRAVAEILADPVFPDVVHQLTRFFQEAAVKPALDFLARKIDDGSLQEVLLFLRRVLTTRG